jgi:hypothetical protein
MTLTGGTGPETAPLTTTPTDHLQELVR